MSHWRRWSSCAAARVRPPSDPPVAFVERGSSSCRSHMWAAEIRRQSARHASHNAAGWLLFVVDGRGWRGRSGDRDITESGWRRLPADDELAPVDARNLFDGTVYNVGRPASSSHRADKESNEECGRR